MTDDLKPCPKCHIRSQLVLISGIQPKSLAVQCGKCGFVLNMESKLPVNPAEIVDEWNRRVKE